MQLKNHLNPFWTAHREMMKWFLMCEQEGDRENPVELNNLSFLLL